MDGEALQESQVGRSGRRRRQEMREKMASESILVIFTFHSDVIQPHPSRFSQFFTFTFT